MGISFTTTSSSTASEYISAERWPSSDSDLKADEERIYEQVIDAKMEVEASRNEAHADLLKTRKLESEAMEAISKVHLISLFVQCS